MKLFSHRNHENKESSPAVSLQRSTRRLIIAIFTAGAIAAAPQAAKAIPGHLQSLQPENRIINSADVEQPSLADFLNHTPTLTPRNGEALLRFIRRFGTEKEDYLCLVNIETGTRVLAPTELKFGERYFLANSPAEAERIAMVISSRTADLLRTAHASGLPTTERQLRMQINNFEVASQRWLPHKIAEFELADTPERKILESLILAANLSLTVNDLVVATNIVETSGGRYLEMMQQAWQDFQESKDLEKLRREANRVARQAVGDAGDTGIIQATRPWCEDFFSERLAEIKSKRATRTAVVELTIELAKQENFSFEEAQSRLATIDPRFALEISNRAITSIGSVAGALKKFENLTPQEILAIAVKSINLGRSDSLRLARSFSDAKKEATSLTLPEFMSSNSRWETAKREEKRTAMLALASAQNFREANSMEAVENHDETKPIKPIVLASNNRSGKDQQQEQFPLARTRRAPDVSEDSPEKDIPPPPAPSLQTAAIYYRHLNETEEMSFRENFQIEAGILHSANELKNSQVSQILANAKRRKYLPSRYLAAAADFYSRRENRAGKNKLSIVNKMLVVLERRKAEIARPPKNLRTDLLRFLRVARESFPKLLSQTERPQSSPNQTEQELAA